MINKTFYSAAILGKVLIVIGVLVLLAIIIGSVIIGGYNRVIALEESVKSSWGQVENQLQRRYDLIPNLVQTVKGYAAHEKEIFSNIAEARTQYFQAKDFPDKARAASQLEGALSRLLFLQERYPDLKANENFLKLQDQLEGTENRIAVERKRYNDAVRGDLNTMCDPFPGRFYASIARCQARRIFRSPQRGDHRADCRFFANRIKNKPPGGIVKTS